MKGKGLVPLLIIALILVGLVIWKRVSTPTRTIADQVDLVQLLPADVKTSDLDKIELYTGAKPDEKVVLVRDESGWRVDSHFSAPVAQDKIDEYFKSLKELQGEFRETAESDDGLKPFDLTDDTAFHVIGYVKDADTPAFHLLVGKAADYRTVFMRTEDQKKVYVEDTNLRQLAGVYGEDTAAAPTATAWLDKQVLKVDEDAITKVALTMPDKSLVFEKKEIKPAEEDKPTEGDADKDDAEKAAEPAKPEYEWVVASGGPGTEMKKTGLDNLLRKVSNLTASDIVDPSKKAEWGLEPPQFKAVISRNGGDDVVIEGGRAEGASDGYVQVASSGQDRVYKLDSYSFGQLFPKGSQLFTLPALAYATDAIDRISVTQPEGNFTVVRDGDTWSVDTPKANMPVQKTTIDTMKTMLTSWKPEDYADSAEGTGFDAPTHVITFDIGGGASQVIDVGNPSKSFDGYYAKLDGNDQVLAMSKTDYNKVFIEPKNLYQLKLVDATAGTVDRIAIERPEDAFAIQKDSEAWSFAAGPTASKVNQDAAAGLANDILTLQAADLIYGEPPAATPIATVRITAGGSDHVLTVQPEQDGRYPVIVADKNQAVWVDNASLDAVVVASASLVEEQEPQAPAAISAPEESAAPATAEPAPAIEIPVTAPQPQAAPASPAEPEGAAAPEAKPAAETPAPAETSTPATPETKPPSEEKAPADAPAPAK